MGMSAPGEPRQLRRSGGRPERCRSDSGARARVAVEQGGRNFVDNEPAGYQYRTDVQVLDKKVERMHDGCAGARRITEELIVGMMNRAELGPRYPPVVRLEKWVHPEFVHAIASGAPVHLKGAAVLRVTLLEGRTAEGSRPGPESSSAARCDSALRRTTRTSTSWTLWESLG